MRELEVLDMFCGAGGTSTGVSQACDALGIKLRLTGINHDELSIDTHTWNHPSSRHFQENLDSLDPRVLYKNRRLNILMASPECTNHSVAKGGRPRLDQSRATAFHVLRWAEALCPDGILVENVKEFQDWGPLIQKVDKKGKPVLTEEGDPWLIPDPDRKGEIFQSWLLCLRSLGYYVSYAVVNCANYGDATTRERFFLLGSREKQLVFPKYTHMQKGESDTDLWVPAKDIIDWEYPSQSIFNRKRPLKPKTIARIVKGFERQITPDTQGMLEPFLVILRGASQSRGLNIPLPTITSGGGHFGLVEPFLTILRGTGTTRDVERPLPTITANGNHLGLVQPFVLGQQSMASARPVSSPIPTISTKGAISLIEPFLIGYYGNSSPYSIDKPMATIPTKDRFGLVSSIGFDVMFRMLQPHELSAATSFPTDYHFCGNKGDTVKQIGNAVPVKTAQALCTCLIEQIRAA